MRPRLAGTEAVFLMVGGNPTDLCSYAGRDCANLFRPPRVDITGWPRTDLRKQRPLEKSWRCANRAEL